MYFKDYNILEQIGRGGFAVVHRAKCLMTGRIVAIKMVNNNVYIYTLFSIMFPIVYV